METYFPLQLPPALIHQIETNVPFAQRHPRIRISPLPRILRQFERSRRDFDAVYIEWNRLLVEAGTGPRLLTDCLRAARRAPLNGRRPWLGRRLVLRGACVAVSDTTPSLGSHGAPPLAGWR